MQAPPTRYKVVERGRRLEVIDTWSGEEVTPLREGPEARRSASPSRDAPDRFTTRGWYDDKAPRDIKLNFAAKARLTNLRYGIAIAVALLVVLSFLFWPFALVLVFAFVATPRLREQLRAAITRWLDGFEQA